MQPAFSFSVDFVFVFVKIVKKEETAKSCFNIIRIHMAFVITGSKVHLSRNAVMNGTDIQPCHFFCVLLLVEFKVFHHLIIFTRDYFDKP